VDVIEWEEAGDAVEACGEVLLDTDLPDFVRRKALLARLIPLTQREPNHPNTLGRARRGARAGAALRRARAAGAPLRARPQRRCGCSVLRARATLFFKRTFGVVMKGVVDADPHVRAAAAEAIGALHFPHAFDPSRGCTATRPTPRCASRRSPPSGASPRWRPWSTCIGTLIHGTEPERRQAEELLVRSDAADASKALQSAGVREGPELQQRIGAVLRKRHAR
jgi:hypothetical protein